MSELAEELISCQYEDNCVEPFPFETCKWIGIKRALLQHFSDEHSESVIDSLSFHVELPKANAFKIYKHQEDFYIPVSNNAKTR